MAYTRKLPYSGGCNRCDCTRTCIVCLYVQFYSEADAREGNVSQNGSVVWRLSDFSALCRCHSCRSVSVWWAELSNSTRIYRHTHPLQKSSCSRYSTQDKIGDLFVPQSNRTRQHGAFPAELCGDVGVFFYLYCITDTFGWNCCKE